MNQVARDNAKEWFVLKMAAMFSPPYHIRSNDAHIERALSEYVNELAAYGPVALDAAWKDVVRSYKGTAWPKLAECIAACDKARDAERYKERQNKPNPFAPKPYEKPSPILTPQQLANVERTIAEQERQAAADRRDYFGRRLSGRRPMSLVRMGRAMIARHHAAKGE